MSFVTQHAMPLEVGGKRRTAVRRFAEAVPINTLPYYKLALIGTVCRGEQIDIRFPGSLCLLCYERDSA